MDEQLNIPEFTDKDKKQTVFHNFTAQPEIVGKLLAIENGTFGLQYRILTNNGEVIVGTYGVLASKIIKQDEGKFIKIVCKGIAKSEKNKGRSYTNFEVFVK